MCDQHRPHTSGHLFDDVQVSLHWHHGSITSSRRRTKSPVEADRAGVHDGSYWLLGRKVFRRLRFVGSSVAEVAIRSSRGGVLGRQYAGLSEATLEDRGRCSAGREHLGTRTSEASARRSLQERIHPCRGRWGRSGCSIDIEGARQRKRRLVPVAGRPWERLVRKGSSAYEFCCAPCVPAGGA